MLYGHIETREERIDHLIRLREQQDASGGFLAFIPLAFHPANTELEDLPSTTGFDDLKTLAIARLMLDNIPHVKAFWIMVGLKVAQISTCFGVDDIDGTVVEERITHMAGATTPEALSKEDLVGMINETGHVPVERDTLYRIVRVYAEEAELPSWDAGPIEPTNAFRRGEDRFGRVGKPGRGDPVKPRLGHIQFLNCLPLYYGLVKNDVLLDVDLVKAAPRDLATMLIAGELDVAPIPAIEYARHADELVLLPDISVSSDGPVLSIMLLSKRPADELGGSHRRAHRHEPHLSGPDPDSAGQTLQGRPDYIEMPPDLAGMMRESDAALLIGDDALRAFYQPTDLLKYDLGQEWKHYTELPMVYAVWAVRREYAEPLSRDGRAPRLGAQPEQRLLAAAP